MSLLGQNLLPPFPEPASSFLSLQASPAKPLQVRKALASLTPKATWIVGYTALFLGLSLALSWTGLSWFLTS